MGFVYFPLTGLLDVAVTIDTFASALRDLPGSGPYSLSGAPALSILCGFTSEGEGALPLAMQIAGRPFDEATVLRVAHAYEQAAGFNKRVPPAAE